MKKDSVMDKEKRNLDKQEAKREKQALTKSNSEIITRIETKIPAKVYDNLQKAFSKAFEIVFEKGVGVIEKTYNKEELLNDYDINDYAVREVGSKKGFRTLHKTAKKSGRFNMLVSTAEGSVLGALGIGLPDIVIFTGMLLKGAYETSLHYGYDYKNEAEKYLILQIMEASLTTGEPYLAINQDVNEVIESGRIYFPTDEEMKEQIRRTSDAMATDMLVMKFIQGLPIIGILGGAMNPVYYKKIIGYMQLKYRRRYLIDMKNKGKVLELKR